MENFFSKMMASKDDNELKDVISKKDSFDSDAVLAAIWEMEKRGLADETTELIKREFSGKIKVQKDEERRRQGTPSIPKITIFLVSFLLTPLFGAILFSINLFDVKQVKGMLLVIGFSILYTVISIIIFNFTSYHFGIIIIINALGAAIISEFFWKKYFKEKATQISRE